MERLTYKLDEPIKGNYLNYKYMRIADYDIKRGNYGRISDWMIYNKLGELEDLMELYHCNSIDDLKTMLENWDKLKEFITGLYAKAEYGGVEHCVTNYILEKMAKLEPKGDE